MLTKEPTDSTVIDTASASQTAVETNRSFVMQVHTLKKCMMNKYVKFAYESLNFEVCHTLQTKKVLDADIRLNIQSIDFSTPLLFQRSDHAQTYFASRCSFRRSLKTH